MTTSIAIALTLAASTYRTIQVNNNLRPIKQIEFVKVSHVSMICNNDLCSSPDGVVSFNSARNIAYGDTTTMYGAQYANLGYDDRWRLMLIVTYDNWIDIYRTSWKTCDIDASTNNIVLNVRSLERSKEITLSANSALKCTFGEDDIMRIEHLNRDS